MTQLPPREADPPLDPLPQPVPDPGPEPHLRPALASAPAVSVVIPCYGQAAFLPEAVASVVAQTFADWEIVIVDDGSPDDTAVVAAGLIARHGDRIRLIRQANSGVARARNAGIAATTGRYVLPLDADDRIHPELLAETVALLDARPEIGFAYTDMQLFDGSDDVRRTPEFDIDQLCRGNVIQNCALVRRTAWQAVGGYNPNMVHGLEDWDFWLSLAERDFPGRRIPRVLFSYRQRPGSRNEVATAHLAELAAQVRANHPTLYTPWRRLRRWARHRLRLARSAAGRLVRRFGRGGPAA